MHLQTARWFPAIPIALIMGCGTSSSPTPGTGPVGGATGGGTSGGATTGGTTSAGATSGGTTMGGASSFGGVATTGGSMPAGGRSLGEGGTATAGTATSGGTKAAGGVTSTSGGAKAAGGVPSAGATASGGSSDAGRGGAASGGSGGTGTSPGCGSTLTTSSCSMKGTTCSLDIAGMPRTYYVQLPKTYDPSIPYRLIFQFHPWGGTAEQALGMYRISSSIPDAIYVTPQGLEAGDNGPGWANTNGQDIAFTKAMLSDVETKYCVDTARVFSVGFSYGGMMSFALGCEMANVFRAIAPMSGALYSDPSCKGTGPAIAVWGSHGTNDQVVPIANGRAARDKMLLQNHCGTQTVPIDPSPCVSYQGCDPGYPVTWCEWDGPHNIPSFGSSAIAAFLKQF
jgi:polyhydroxybutyrate depolymerase